MTPDDLGRLIGLLDRMLKMVKFDDDEVARWAFVLGDLPCDYATAELALKRVMQRKAFVEPHELALEIKAIRSARHAEVPPYEVPDFGDDDRYRAELKNIFGAIGDGRGLGRLSGAIERAPEPVAAPEASVAARVAAHGRDAEFVRLREGSLAQPCSWCKAAVGEPCVNGEGRELTLEPAHRVRLERAGLVEQLPRQSQEEALAALESILRASGGQGE